MIVIYSDSFFLTSPPFPPRPPNINVRSLMRTCCKLDSTIVPVGTFISRFLIFGNSGSPSFLNKAGYPPISLLHVVVHTAWIFRDSFISKDADSDTTDWNERHCVFLLTDTWLYILVVVKAIFYLFATLICKGFICFTRNLHSRSRTSPIYNYFIRFSSAQCRYGRRQLELSMAK